MSHFLPISTAYFDFEEQKKTTIFHAGKNILPAYHERTAGCSVENKRKSSGEQRKK